MFGFFGGKVEEGEEILEALRREAEEELGIRIRDIRFLGSYRFEDHKFVYSMPAGPEFDNIQTNEGEFGRFFTEKGIDADRNSVMPAALHILRDFFSSIHSSLP